jgi:hypothetical protein
VLISPFLARLDKHKYLKRYIALYMAENEEKTYILFEQNGQMKLTIPKILAQAVGLRKSDKVKLIVDRGELVIRKA